MFVEDINKLLFNSSDTNLKYATSEKIDLSKPEDVVLALGYAYAFMYHRASDQKESEAALSKYHELFNAYDMTTGKPLPKSDNKKTEPLSNSELAAELAALKEDIKKLRTRLIDVEDIIYGEDAKEHVEALVRIDRLEKEIPNLRDAVNYNRPRLKSAEEDIKNLYKRVIDIEDIVYGAMEG